MANANRRRDRSRILSTSSSVMERTNSRPDRFQRATEMSVPEIRTLRCFGLGIGNALMRRGGRRSERTAEALVAETVTTAEHKRLLIEMARCWFDLAEG